MVMPNFLIIGAAKAGTTSLFHYLDQHPEVFMSKIKEPRFFAVEKNHPDIGDDPVKKRIWANTITSLEQYQALFAEATNQKAIGEVSPLYLGWSQLSSESIQKYIPNVKLVACLRNPSDRAFSHFLHNIRIKAEKSRDFEKIFRTNPNHHYFSLGMYYKLLKPYYDRFPSEQIRIYLFEDLLKKPNDLIVDLFRFLGVNEHYEINIETKYNQSRIPRNDFLQEIADSKVIKVLPVKIQKKIQNVLKDVNYYKPYISQEMKHELTQYFSDDIICLQHLINRDLSHWLM